MACVLVYRGTRYELDARYDINDVINAISERLNRIAHTTGDLDSRPRVLMGGVGYEDDHGIGDHDPFLMFHLANGLDIWLLIHDQVDLLVETDERVIQLDNPSSIVRDPLGE